MLNKRILTNAIALALATTSFTINAKEFCIGNFFSQTEEIPDVNPPTVRIITDQLLQLKAGESLTFTLDYTNDSGEADFFSCVDKGSLTQIDSGQLTYTAPPFIGKTEIIKLGTQISDNLGYVGGDSLLLRLFASGEANSYIVVGTSDGKILIYSFTGNLENDITEIAEQLDAIDSDDDSLDEIIADDGTNISVYEFNGTSSEPLSLDDAFFVKADINGDGTDETIEGSNSKVRINGISFPVFESARTSSRTTRKGKKSKIDICHKGKVINVSENALKGHLGHGDTEGACPPPPKPIIEISVEEPTPKPPIEIPVEEPTSKPPIEIPTTTYSVNVDAGDLNGNGNAEIVAAMAEKGSLVEVYDGNKTLLKSFQAFTSNVGVLVAVGDGKIITAEPDGTEIRIFDIDGNQIDNFTVENNIISLAFGHGFIEEIVIPDEIQNEFDDNLEITDEVIESQENSLFRDEEQDDIIAESDNEPTTTTESPIVAPPPTTGIISGIYDDYQGKTVTDVTITENSSISNVVLAGKTIINQGLVSNATVSEDTTFIGGKMTGIIMNYGTIMDIIFVGERLTGDGALAGIILIEEHITDAGLGILQDVTLAKDTIIIGGIFEGTITGDPEGEACLEPAVIHPDAELINVVIKDDCQIEER